MISIITRPKGSGSHALYALAKSTKVTMKNGRDSSGKLNTKIALGVTMSEEEWTETKEVLSSFELAAKANRNVSYMGNPIIPKIWEIKKELDAMVKAGFFDTEMAKEKIRVILHKEEIEKIKAEREKNAERNKITILSYVKQQLSDSRSGKRCNLRTGLPLSENTIRAKEVWYRFFERYSINRKVNLTFDDIDWDFFDDFKSYMMNLKYKDGTKKILRQNSISDNIKFMRCFMSDAYSEGITKNDIFRNKRFKVTPAQVDNIALTEEQIDQFLSIDFNDEKSIMAMIKANYDKGVYAKEEYPRWLKFDDKKRHEIARDIFVVGCLTGQRFSDYSRFNKGMYVTIGNYTFLRFKQKKTKEEVKIPVDKRVDMILTKYGGKLPKHGEGMLNKELKRIGELLGWTDYIEMKTTEGLVEKKKTVRFCDCISSHTARRSWATNAYKRGLSLSRIMSVTGHKSEACLRRYLKIEKNEDALMTANELSKYMSLMS